MTQEPEELCSECGEEPVHLSTYCKRCAAERGIVADGPESN